MAFVFRLRSKIKVAYCKFSDLESILYFWPRGSLDLIYLRQGSISRASLLDFSAFPPSALLIGSRCADHALAADLPVSIASRIQAGGPLLVLLGRRLAGLGKLAVVGRHLPRLVLLGPRRPNVSRRLAPLMAGPDPLAGVAAGFLISLARFWTTLPFFPV